MDRLAQAWTSAGSGIAVLPRRIMSASRSPRTSRSSALIRSRSSVVGPLALTALRLARVVRQPGQD